MSANALIPTLFGVFGLIVAWYIFQKVKAYPEGEAKVKDITLGVQAGPLAYTAQADEDRMQQVLINLISNAIKYTPRGGNIQVRAIATNSSFVIDIADSGPGIPQEERSRIFQAFYQGANQQHDGPVAGTGIGLSVVLECVQAHGGSVELVDSPWGGAHFRLHIPQEQISVNDRMAANA